MLTCFSVILAPFIRSEIGAEQLVGVIMQISGICFAAFWFPNARDTQRARITIKDEQAIGALALTCGYMILVFLLLLIPLYFVDYKADANGNPRTGESLTERISEMVKFALLISPLVLAPVSYLTAGHPDSSESNGVKGPAKDEDRDPNAV